MIPDIKSGDRQRLIRTLRSQLSVITSFGDRLGKDDPTNPLREGFERLRKSVEAFIGSIEKIPGAIRDATAVEQDVDRVTFFVPQRGEGAAPLAGDDQEYRPGTERADRCNQGLLPLLPLLLQMRPPLPQVAGLRRL